MTRLESPRGGSDRDLLNARLALADVRAALHGADAQQAAQSRTAGRAQSELRRRIETLEEELADQRLVEQALHGTIAQLRTSLADLRHQSIGRAVASRMRRLVRRLREPRLRLQAASLPPPAPIEAPALEAVPPAPTLSPLHAPILASGVFDAEFYLANNQDVAASAADPLQHYLDYGHKEGRRPNAMFDEDWYLEVNDDVARAGIGALYHFAVFGAFEGRDPHPDFSTKFYLQNLPEPLPPGVNPLAHYLRGSKHDQSLIRSPVARYRDRISRQRLQDAVERPELLQHIAVMTYRPDFVILAEGAGADASLSSVAQQLYPPEMICRTRVELSAALARLDPLTTYVVWLADGDLLSEQALYAFAAALNADPELHLIYADEDRIVADGRRDPFFKPAWSPDLLESIDYVSACACIRATLVSPELADLTSRYDLVLRATERTAAIGHLRQILCHRRNGIADPALPHRIDADKAALAGRLSRTGRSGTVETAVPGYAAFRITLDLRPEPLVSVIIPTAGKIVEIDGREVDLIVNCIDAILARSTFRNLEFVVVDNGDFDRTRLSHIAPESVRFATYTEPVFNVAKKLNLGAEIAKGPVLLLLNDDVEPIAPAWIERMLAHLQKPHVGVVGAKLFFTDMTVQHQGVVLNAGIPDHVRRWVPRDDLGYMFSSRTPRNYLAVTGACMMTSAALYRAVGGYTETLGVCYNDVDFCLKLRERGLTVVADPDAELLHFESRSRVGGVDAVEASWFQARWGSISTDPYYNEDEFDVAPSSYDVHHNERLL